ncbi:MAG TPA: YceI family protein [Solirubrobacterales bacterium]|nr:YceI family protein [Solirubrobacterales bacterium]
MSTDTVNQKVPTGTWTVDPVHSSITFAVTHNNVATFRSGFDSYEATLTGGGEPKLEGSVDVASIDIDEAQLKGHLMAPDFFDAERFPKLTFSSTRLDVADDGTVRLAGELTIKGNTREVEATGRFGELPADLGGNPRVALSVSTAVDRREYGIEFNADLPSGGQVLEWEVAINVDLELVAREA